MDSYTVIVQSNGPKTPKILLFCPWEVIQTIYKQKKVNFEFFDFCQNHLILDWLVENFYKWPK